MTNSTRQTNAAIRGTVRGDGGLCVETQSREIMAVLVHDVVAEAMRLNLHGSPGKSISKANGTRLRHGNAKVRNG